MEAYARAKEKTALFGNGRMAEEFAKIEEQRVKLRKLLREQGQLRKTNPQGLILRRERLARELAAKYANNMKKTYGRQIRANIEGALEFIPPKLLQVLKTRIAGTNSTQAQFLNKLTNRIIILPENILQGLCAEVGYKKKANIGGFYLPGDGLSVGYVFTMEKNRRLIKPAKSKSREQLLKIHSLDSFGGLWSHEIIHLIDGALGLSRRPVDIEVLSTAVGLFLYAKRGPKKRAEVEELIGTKYVRKRMPPEYSQSVQKGYTTVKHALELEQTQGPVAAQKFLQRLYGQSTLPPGNINRVAAQIRLAMQE